MIGRWVGKGRGRVRRAASQRPQFCMLEQAEAVLRTAPAGGEIEAAAKAELLGGPGEEGASGAPAAKRARRAAAAATKRRRS